MKKIIVIGMSAASVAFVTKLRSFDQESEIICFSGEPDLPYNRCFLADVLTGESTQEQITLKPQDFFAKNNIAVFYNTWVTKIDTEHKLVYVGDLSYPYDVLFIGTGTHTMVPKFAQDCTASGLFTFHTLQDMHAIMDHINRFKPKTALVIGAGLNGLEAVSSLQERGIAVGVIEAQETVLASQVDVQLSEFITSIMAHKGVLTVTGHKVVQLCIRSNHVVGVQLDSRTHLGADMIILAAGSVVNSQLLHGTGIELNNGSIVVDEHLKTSVDGVLAAGDVCMVKDFVTGKMTRSTTWSDAMLQGLCAATTLSQSPRVYQGMIGLRDSYFFGKDFYACGKTVGYLVDSGVEMITKMDEHGIAKFYVKDKVLQGFVLIGNSGVADGIISRIGEFKKWYVTKQTIDQSMF